VPKQDAAQQAWLTSLKAGFPKHSADLNLTPERVAQIHDWIDTHLDALKLVRQKRDEWLAASAQKKLVARTSLAGLRKEIARWKTEPNASPGLVAELGLSQSLPVLDTASHQPELSAGIFGGAVRLRFKKRGAASVNIYMRRAGEAQGRLLARVSKSPYLDTTPVATPGTPETREYYALGVKDDQEIGQPSDAVSITVPG
jgi:hypothetical protein